MIEIGKNLKYEQFLFHELGELSLKLKNRSNLIVEVKISDIDQVELVGVKSNSEFRGTMDWGMSNPTFILPTTICYNIFRLFKNKKKEVALYRITLNDGKTYIVHTPSDSGVDLLVLNRR